MTGLPRPGTAAGQAGLQALLANPRHALIAMDFDGTLSPIVANPDDARAQPGAVAAMTALAKAVGTVAVITGRLSGGRGPPGRVRGRPRPYCARPLRLAAVAGRPVFRA